MKVSKVDFVTKYVIEIYLIGKRNCVFKSIPLDEDEVEQFYNEMNENSKIMEFGTFYFSKDRFDYAKVKEVKIKID